MYIKYKHNEISAEDLLDDVPLANTLTTMLLFLSAQQKMLNRLWNECLLYLAVIQLWHPVLPVSADCPEQTSNEVSPFVASTLFSPMIRRFCMNVRRLILNCDVITSKIWLWAQK